MQALVTITLIDEDERELERITGSSYSPWADWTELPAEAFAIALRELRIRLENEEQGG